MVLVFYEENNLNTVQLIKPPEPPVLSGFNDFLVRLPVFR